MSLFLLEIKKTSSGAVFTHPSVSSYRVFPKVVGESFVISRNDEFVLITKTASSTAEEHCPTYADAVGKMNKVRDS